MSCYHKSAALLLALLLPFAHAQTPQFALTAVLHGTRASGAVLEARTGAVLATAGPVAGGAPGSVLKPLWLTYALQHGIVSPQTTVYCHRNLRLGNRSLACSHPADHTVFTAETALAESCNTFFAALARRLSGPQLDAVLDAAHLPHAPLASATEDQRQLAVLGLYGIRVTPLQVANVYRDLLPNLAPAVTAGLRGSVSYGMANPARVPGLDLLGKTGTAGEPGQSWTHGWFAGVVPGKLILVVYVPNGDGGTAARLAHAFFTALAHAGSAR